MTNKANDLGRLEKVELRDIWTNEAVDFTPWLAEEENLGLLGDTIGLELELEAKEKEVGPFQADILCKDTATSQWVVIENQLERTDHKHLGQLLTYAAGLKAVTIVWIAEKFTEEHRATLDWLNEITDNQFNFFGLEVELWRIGSSPVAPKFNMACKPNDWSKVIRGPHPSLTESKQLQLDFWTDFHIYVKDRGSKIKPTKPLPQHWMSIAIGRSGFQLSAIAAFFDSVAKSFDNHELRAEFVIANANSKDHFKTLEGMKAQVEAELGEELTWHNPLDKQMCRIYVRQLADLKDRERWPEYHAWLLQKLEALHRTFAQRVKQLDIGQNELAETEEA